ncbi:MAG: toxin HicA [Acidimicrobiales bacterium]
MKRDDRLLRDMRTAPQNIAFNDVVKVCEAFFGEPRHRSGSHVVFSMPWSGDPRINLQKGNGGKAKAYQVRQALVAIDRLQREADEQKQGGDDDA